jgi:hypothetical protein
VIAHFRTCIRVVSVSLLGVVFCWSMNSETARAAVIITAPTVSIPYSATDRIENVEVYVQDTDATLPNIGDEQVELKLPNDPNVFFSGTGPTTGHPYLFNPQTPGSSVANYVVYGTDYPYEIAPPALADGDGLLMIQITVKGGATGAYPLTFDTDLLSDAGATALFDQANQPISFTVQNGSIEIGPTPVPEPSSIVLALLAILGAGFVAHRRRRRSVVAHFTAN